MSDLLARLQRAFADAYHLEHELGGGGISSCSDVRDAGRDAYANLRQAAALDPRSLLMLREAGFTAMRIKAYPDAERYYTRIVALAPDEADGYGGLALFHLLAAGDSGKVREVVQAGLSRVGPDRLIPALYRTGSVSLLLLSIPEAGPVAYAVPAGASGLDTAVYFLWRAEFNRYHEAAQPARVYADSARVVLERQIRQRPGDWAYHSLLGIAGALLNRREVAVTEAKAAVELLPIEKDAFGGEVPIWFLARVYTILGEKDLAVDRLKVLIANHGQTTAASLPVDPNWPLSGVIRTSSAWWPAAERLAFFR